jgi:hypothetical protein
MNTEYIRHNRDNLSYYIRPEVFEHVSEMLDLKTLSDFRITAISDFVVDTNTNTFVKSRYLLEDLLANAFNVVPVEQPSDTVVESVKNLRDELVNRAQHDTTAREFLFKLNSCLYKQYPHR